MKLHVYHFSLNFGQTNNLHKTSWLLLSDGPTICRLDTHLQNPLYPETIHTFKILHPQELQTSPHPETTASGQTDKTVRSTSQMQQEAEATADRNSCRNDWFCSRGFQVSSRCHQGWIVSLIPNGINRFKASKSQTRQDQDK
jgi:hypothetical protein